MHVFWLAADSGYSNVLLLLLLMMMMVVVVMMVTIAWHFTAGIYCSD